MLLLDEPTAHLAPATEALVLKRLRQHARNTQTTVVMAAHRPAAIAAADHVVRLTPPGGETGPPTSDAELDVTAARTDTTAETCPDSATDTEAMATATASRQRIARTATAGVLTGALGNLFEPALTATGAVLIVLAAAHPPLLALSVPIVLVRLLALGRPLLRYLERLLTHDAALATLTDLRVDVWRRLVPRVPGPDIPARGDLLTRLANDVDDHADATVRGPWAATAALVGLTTAVLAAALVSPGAGAALFGGLLLAASWSLLIGPAAQRRTAGDVRAARGQRATAIVEVLTAGADLAGNDIDPVTLTRDRDEGYRRALRGQAAREVLTEAPTALIAGLLPGLITVVLAAAARPSGLAVAPVIATALVLGTVVVADQAQSLGPAGTAIRRRSAARRRLESVTRATVGSVDPADPEELPLPSRPGTHALGFDRVHASWSATRPTLTGVDLKLEPGSRTAVTGASGSGKSTLASVALHLLDPTEGLVSLSGTSYARLPGSALRETVGAVGVADHIFALSVRDNLTLEDPDLDDPAVLRVLGMLRLLPWLATLPNGLDTQLGAGGHVPSGGQALRLAAGRALLRQPELLVLDEPTEGLDVPTARAILGDLARSNPTQTWLLLAHRTDGLELVHQTYRLHTGSIRPQEPLMPLPRVETLGSSCSLPNTRSAEGAG